MASHVVITVFSVVIAVILGRHEQHTPGPDAVVGGSLGSALSLLHVGLVQAPSAGVRVLLASGR